jgi:phosphate uptake regulator
MKRKVIQLAGKTLVVSLPHKWAKKYGVKKGDEVEVEEEERRIVIKARGSGETAVHTIDVKDLKLMLNRTIGALYKAGYDDIEVTYYSPEQYTTIRDTLNRTCMGFEIIKHGPKILNIKNLSDLHPQEFENILRRLFLTLLSSAEDSLLYLQQGNVKGMEEIILRDPQINKYSDFCRRVLNIQGYESTKKTTTYYHICEELERIGDAYGDLMKFMIANKIKKVDAATLNLISEINQYLRLFYELFYQFDLKKLEEFGELSAKLRGELEKRFTSSSVNVIKLNHHLYKIFFMIFNMNGALITANI